MSVTQDFMAEAKAIDNELTEVMNYLGSDYAPKLTDLSPTRPQLCTMTVSFKTNLSFCNLSEPETFEEHLPSCMSVSKPRGKKGDMLNCLIFKIRTNGDDIHSPIASRKIKRGKSAETEKVAIMLFVNGSMNITGCKKAEDACKSALIMCAVLDRMNGVSPGKTKIRSMKLQMINTYFTTATGFFLDKLHHLMVHKYKMNAALDKEVHPGIVIDFRTSFAPKRDVTIAVFSSGSIIITGVLDPVQLKESYIAVTQMINTDFADVCRLPWFDECASEEEAPKKRGRKPKSEEVAMHNACIRLIGSY